MTTANAVPSTIARFMLSLPLEAQDVSHDVVGFIGLKDEIWHVAVTRLEKHLQRERGRRRQLCDLREVGCKNSHGLRFDRVAAGAPLARKPASCFNTAAQILSSDRLQRRQ